MPRFTVVLDVDTAPWVPDLTQGDCHALARAASTGAAQLVRATGDLWDRVVTVEPVRFEIDGDVYVSDSPF